MTTRIVDAAAVGLGLLLSVVVALALTRSIVRPLERLRQLAERASSGDLQDVDVAFRCLELEAGCSRECLDLAESLRRMVTSLRLLVPTEQGLMDTYQMAILVLVNRAVGPAGRAVVERALRRANLASLADVSPASAEPFLEALRAELGDGLPEDSLAVLTEAIRELR